MTDTLEQRVGSLERDMRSVLARLESAEPRIEATEQDLQGIPALIKAEFRLVESRDARMRAEMADLKTQLTQHMDDKFDAIMRAIAETIAERGRRS